MLSRTVIDIINIVYRAMYFIQVVSFIDRIITIHPR